MLRELHEILKRLLAERIRRTSFVDIDVVLPVMDHREISIESGAVELRFLHIFLTQDFLELRAVKERRDDREKKLAD